LITEITLWDTIDRKVLKMLNTTFQCYAIFMESIFILMRI